MSRAESIEDMRYVMAQFWAKKPIEHSLSKEIDEMQRDVKRSEGKSEVPAWQRKRGYVVKDSQGIHIKVG